METKSLIVAFHMMFAPFAFWSFLKALDVPLFGWLPPIPFTKWMVVVLFVISCLWGLGVVALLWQKVWRNHLDNRMKSAALKRFEKQKN